MATISKIILSGSTDGKAVKVAATATAGTLIHTAVSGTTDVDEIYLWVTNTDSSARTLTLEYGGATDPDCLICKAVSIPANSRPIPICFGFLLQNGLTVRAFASSANVLLITGYVHRFDNA